MGSCGLLKQEVLGSMIVACQRGRVLRLVVSMRAMECGVRECTETVEGCSCRIICLVVDYTAV